MANENGKAPEDLKIDTHKSFREIFSTPSAARAQLIEITQALHTRSLEPEQLKVLAIRRNSPSDSNPQLQQSTQSSTQRDGAYRSFQDQDADDPNLVLDLIIPEVLTGNDVLEYTAVSYCWANETGLETRTYEPVKIRTSDGSVRSSRATAKVLRRAVRHAASFGQKYFWIDQEGINQDDHTEKEQAIQCMDRVYRNASNVLCLLNAEIDHQEDLDVLESLHNANRRGPSGLFNSFGRDLGLDIKRPLEMALSLSRILDTAANDRFLTRAWITQERICSSSVTSFETWATTARGLYSRLDGEICINYRDQIRDAEETLQMLESIHILDFERQRRVAENLRVSIRRFKDAFRLPSPAAVRRRLCEEKRSLYNVLQIVKVLESQECLINADKLALVANCCEWTKRIDTRHAQDRGWSFSACIWAMALANGDSSIFCPDPICNPLGTAVTRMWSPQGSTRILDRQCSGLIDHVSLSSLEDNGISSSGWLFKIERFLDLGDMKSPLQELSKVLPTPVPHRRTKQPAALDEEVQLQLFFWLLLQNLHRMGEYEVAELLWHAVKYRARGGFYGRSLVELTIDHFSNNVVNMLTGEIMLKYKDLCLEDEDQSERAKLEEQGMVYQSPHHDLSLALHRNCALGPCEGRQVGCLINPLTKDNIFRLLGSEAQLAGLAWMRDSVWQQGGLTIGRLVSSQVTPRPTNRQNESNDDQEDNTLSKFSSTPMISDQPIPTSNMSSNHSVEVGGSLYVQHREIRKYRPGDAKAMHLVHPFEIWHKDKHDHNDTPYSWAADAQASDKGGKLVQLKQSCHCLFDIGSNRPEEHILNWPKEYQQDSWDTISCCNENLAATTSHVPRDIMRQHIFENDQRLRDNGRAWSTIAITSEAGTTRRYPFESDCTKSTSSFFDFHAGTDAPGAPDLYDSITEIENDMVKLQRKLFKNWTPLKHRK